MKYDDLPEEIKLTAERINDLYKKWDYSPTIGSTNADRSHGDNIRIGKLNAKLRRLCEQHSLDYAKVLFVLGKCNYSL